MIVEFIDANGDELGIEPICEALQVASSTYYDNKKRSGDAADPGSTG